MKDETRRLLRKAERAVRAARILLENDDAEFAAGRVYYAMFYVAEALLHERGLSYSKHGAVHAAYGKEFAKTGLLDPKFHRWLIDAFDTRLQTDYGTEAVLTPEGVKSLLEQARSFASAAIRYLGATVEESPAGDEELS